MQTGEKTFTLYPVKEIHATDQAGGDVQQVSVTNPDAAQALQFALQVAAPVDGCVITLPDGSQIQADRKMEKGQFILCQDNQAYVADHNRKKIADLPLAQPAQLPAGESRFGVKFSVAGGAKVKFNLTVWVFGKSEAVKASQN